MDTNQRTFPDLHTWRQTVVKPGDLPQYLRQDFYEYYQGKFEIAQASHPASICEIGVRYGYSAHAFLCAAPHASFTGFDILAGTHGGVPEDTFDYVYPMLKNHFPDAKVTLFHKDTRQLDTLASSFDFIHIDGNHSEMACWHDLLLAERACKKGGTILVDDYNYIAGVRRAADQFWNDKRDRFQSRQIRPSLRGELILVKGNAP